MTALLWCWEFWGTALVATFSRTAIIVLALGLALTGCGRKGGLEPPPSASVASATPVTGPTLGEPEHGALESERREAAAPTPFVRKKSFFLDPLIASERPRPEPAPR
jgi:predicted small lipoprotein YifL